MLIVIPTPTNEKIETVLYGIDNFLKLTSISFSCFGEKTLLTKLPVFKVIACNLDVSWVLQLEKMITKPLSVKHNKCYQISTINTC